jgi:hypothetical protein
MELVLNIFLGIGLSAACGFRVFVPLLIMSMASLSGHLHFSPGFAWLGTYQALTVFSVATAMEIAGYYIPWLGHFLDILATPAAVVAGTIATAAVVAHTDPMLKWTMAIIAGGGAAGIIQGATVFARGVSNAGTAGLATPLVSSIELGASIVTSVLAILAPVLLIVLLAIALFIFCRLIRRSVGKSSKVETFPAP